MGFYRRILKCLVLIGLKRGGVQQGDAGQTDFHMDHCREERNAPGDAESIGILPGSRKDRLAMQDALHTMTAGRSRQFWMMPSVNILKAERAQRQGGMSSRR